MFDKKKMPKQDDKNLENLRNISDNLNKKYNITDENFEKIMTPSGKQKINPIISIKNVNCDFPIIINQKTGEAANNKTYYAELLDSVRTRAEALKNKEGLEYEILIANDTTPGERTDLLESNIEATDGTLVTVLAEDIMSSLHSVACNIEEKVILFLDNCGLESFCHKDIELPNQQDIIRIFSYGYPNRNISKDQVNAATYFDFVANRKLQIMNNFCMDVYNFLRSIAYDPSIKVLEQFDTRDTLYATLCYNIYNDLACLDDALSALITAHCVRIENCKTPARVIYNNQSDSNDNSKFLC